MPRFAHPSTAAVLSLGAAVLLSSCSAPPGTTAPEDGRASVVAAFYPLEYVAKQVGGDAVAVTSLTPPGVEPHDLELSAAQVAQIAGADVVLYVKGFQPAVDEAVAQQAAGHAIDVAEGLDIIDSQASAGDGSDGGAADPHVWLDPANMAAIGQRLADRLAEIDPADADSLQARSATLTTAMTDLDQLFTNGLATCATRDLVVSHEAFGYLARAYNLTQIGISGLSPDAEPSPARLREVAQLVLDKDISTIYYETLVDPKVAQTVADETGATAAVLDPLEGLVPGSDADYVSVMTANLATLAAGQSCT